MSDSISRQAAIDALREDWSLVLDTIEFLPPAQSRNGKWIGYNAEDKDWQRNDGSPVLMHCSECNEFVINISSSNWNFCPNCGADMRGDSNE